MSRHLILPALLCAGVNFLHAGDDLPPGGKFSLPDGQFTAREFAARLETASGLKIDISAIDGSAKVAGPLIDSGYWATLEHLARHTRSRLHLVGGQIALKPGVETVTADLHGPFRLTARDVSLRKDFTTGAAVCDLQLEAAWLPTVHAYRIDASPKIDTITDDAGNKYAVGSAGARTFTSGTTAPLTVRPLGLKRTAKSLDVTGSVQMTLADELLTFQFNALKPLAMPRQKGVGATIRKIGTEGTSWYAEVELSYPATVVWESYEIYWTRDNRLRLLPPNGQPFNPDDVEYGDRTIRYVFKNRAGKIGSDWNLDYQTPGPMRELRVGFSLKGIELP